MARVGETRGRRAEPRVGREGLVVTGGDGAAHFQHPPGLGQLCPAHGGQEVGKIVLESGFDHRVAPGGFPVRVAVPDGPVDAVRAHDGDAGGKLRIGRDDHASFSGGDRLGGVE